MSDEKRKENEEGKVIHTYDGIDELDHGIPKWFQGLFYATLIFGAGYYAYYELGDGPGQVVEYQREMRALEIAQAEKASKDDGKEPGEEELIAMAKDAEITKKGSASFQSKCASCHGSEAQGGIGPNLTDDFWIHGGKMEDVVKTISKGIPEKGMPPWGPVLSKLEIRSLAAYIRKTKGSSPAGARAPQGVKVE